jgi:hypothetical protein
VSSAVLFYGTYSTGYTSEITATPDDDEEAVPTTRAVEVPNFEKRTLLSAVTSAMLFYSIDSTGYTSDITATSRVTHLPSIQQN